MKKFVLKSLLFLLPIVLFYGILEIGLRNIPNNYNYKKEYLDKNAGELEVLVLGSSHSYRGINPDFFSHYAFNASYVAQTLNIDLYIFKMYADSFEKLKVLVVPISYQSLFNKLEDHPEKWRLKNYVLYWDYPGFRYSLINRSEIFGKPQKGSQQVKRFVEYYLLNKDPITVNKKGFEGRKLQVKNFEKSGLAAALRHSAKTEKLLLFNKNVIQEIIDHSNEKKTKVLLITLPGHENYTSNLNQDQLRSMQQVISSLLISNADVHYENYLFDKRFDKTDFADPDHLNESGAEKFTTILDQSIKNLIKHK